METTIGSGADFVNPNPLIRPGIYARSQVMRLLGITDRTLKRWEQAGLQKLQPATDAVFYEGADIMRIMRTPAKDIPPYRPKSGEEGK